MSIPNTFPKPITGSPAPRVMTPDEIASADQAASAQRAMADAEAQRAAAFRAAAEASQAEIANAAGNRLSALGVAPGDVPAEDMAAGSVREGQRMFSDALDLATARNPSQRVARPGYGPRAEFYGTMLGTTEAPGLVDQQRQAEVDRQGAALNYARTSTDLLAEEADMQRRLQVDLHAAEMARQQRAESVRKRVDDAYAITQRATADLLKHSDIDPDRGWGEKGAGAKVLAILGAGLMGFGGIGDPLAHINAVIERSLDAQKFNRDAAGQRVDAARAQQASAESSWENLRAQLGDEQVADNAYRVMALERIRAEAAAKLAEAGIQVLSADQKMLMNGLDQQIAEAKKRLQLGVEANTPTMVVGGGPKYTGQAAKLIGKYGEAGLDMMTTGTKSAADIAAKRQDETRKAAAAGAKPDAAQRRIDFSQMQYISDNTKKARARLHMINSFRKKYAPDIPGISWINRFASGEIPKAVLDQAGRDARAELKRIYLSRLREETGAAYNTKEEYDAAENYIDSFGEDDVFHELARQEEMDVSSIRDTVRAVEPDVAQKWFGTTNLPALAPDTTGLQTQAEAGQDVVWEEDQ